MNKETNINGAETDARKPFVKRNFLYMLISLAMIVAGFLLMTGSANGEGAAFNEDIFSTRRIVIGPAIAFLGFVAMAFAILYTPKNKKAK
jgi:hypothetical protein